jgi:2-polyprenyl-6-methoxyphenol hydroxylase-like FAD-dependent oxidoreductase
VIGASMSGLCAARVLADRFDHVVLVERDEIDASPQQRRGVPQGRHAHGLLPPGAAQLEEWFPDLHDEVSAAGALTFDYGRLSWHQGGSYRRQLDSGIDLILCSRPLLEHHVRRRLLQRPNVVLRSGSGACGLTTDAERITGVRLDDGGTISADLVVDASGRAARSLTWLQKIGHQPPPTSVVTINVGYASRIVRFNAADPPALVPAFAVPEPPSLRAGVAFPMEDGAWMITLAAWHGDCAAMNDDAFLAYARSLPNPRLAELLSAADQASEIVTHRLPSNQRRHVERWRRPPTGLVLFGDAICSFNPIYGQGMTTAAWQARCLGEALDTARGTGAHLSRTFHRRVAKVIETPWRMSTGGDFTFAATTGPKPRGTDLINRYMRHVVLASHTSERVSRRLIEVTALLRPPAALLTPRMLVTVLHTARRSPARQPSPTIGPSAADTTRSREAALP